MCRLLMASSNEPLNSKALLEVFATACEKAVAPNGDLQEDGWGVAWLDTEDNWQTKKSLHPIWKDSASFSSVPNTKLLVVHARSATFPGEKGDLSFNQPYIAGKYCFVFNGALKGVKLDRPVPGKIGAQKIWSLLQEQLKVNSPADSLEKTENYLEQNSREIIALNIGIATPDSLSAICKYTAHPEYYTLHYSENTVKVICSENLQGYELEDIQNNQVRKIKI